MEAGIIADGNDVVANNIMDQMKKHVLSDEVLFAAKYQVRKHRDLQKVMIKQ